MAREEVSTRTSSFFVVGIRIIIRFVKSDCSGRVNTVFIFRHSAIFTPRNTCIIRKFCWII